MTITELVQRMTEAGATPLIISIAVEAYESVSVLRTNEDSPQDMPDTRADRIRKLDRLRKRKIREKQRLNRELAKANDVAKPPRIKPDINTDVSTDKSFPRSNLTSFLPSLLTSKEGNREVENKKEETTRAKNKKGTRLSENSGLSQKNYEFAIENGIISPGELWKEFVDFWVGIPGHRGVKLNWDSTWRNNVRRVVKLNGGKNENGTHYQTGNGRSNAADNFRAGMASALSSRPDSRLFKAKNIGEQSSQREPASIHLLGNSKTS